MVEKEPEIEETDVIYPVPDEVQEEILNGEEIIVFCWACMQVLYASAPLNTTTERVAEITADGHHLSFEEYHYIDIYRNRKGGDH
jgi:hypothetical protein